MIPARIGSAFFRWRIAMRMADMDSREGRWDSQEFQKSERPGLYSRPAFCELRLVVAENRPTVVLLKLSHGCGALCVIPIPPRCRIVAQSGVRNLPQGLVNPRACCRVQRRVVGQFQ